MFQGPDGHVDSRGFGDHHGREGENEAKEAGACECLSQPGSQSPEVTGFWAWGGRWWVREKMEAELVVSMSLP